jgi:hypothetical protein
MRTYGPTLVLVTFVGLASSPAVTQGPPASRQAIPKALSAIKTAPAEMGHLERIVDAERNLEDEGSERPPVIYYDQARPKDLGTFMAVTDLSLCQRPSEREICAAFRKMISGPLPAVGDDISNSRIGGVGYATIFLARVDGVQLAGVDRMVAFIGGDTQDGPVTQVVLYIYAQSGSNLLQLVTSAGHCHGRVPDRFLQEPAPGAKPTPEAKVRAEEDAYYRRACMNEATLRQARAAGSRLVELFRLKP